jgi:endonuclease/exonuclease/phosphatase family metal-dependent hydrolase
MAKKKKKNLLKIIFTAIFFILNSVAAVALFFSFLAHFIPPATSMIVTYCGLAFPYLLFVNLGFIIFWIFIRYQFALLSLIIVLLNVNNIDKYYQMRGLDKPNPCDNCIKMMSYNVKLFGLYNSNDMAEQLQGRNKIFQFLREEQPDIVCFQEYFVEKSNHLNFETTDSILSILNIKKRYQHENAGFYRTYFPVHTEEYFFGVAIFSKYRIIHSGFIPFPDTTTNSAMFADIRYKKDTIRIYSMHLASYHINPKELDISKMLGSDMLNSPKFNKKAKKLSRLMHKAYIQRGEQAKIIRAHIDSCRYPVIICGDFNDPPNSYTAHKIGKGFKDSFRTSGNGKGVTYHEALFPHYRIDYIFYDKHYNSYGHTVHTNLTVSDHYPVSTYISVKRR